MTNEASIELTLSLDPQLHDLLVAELDGVGFNGFIQEDAQFQAYIPKRLWNDTTREALNNWLASHAPNAAWKEFEIVPQDWNKAWESSIQPIDIPPFYVRPSWAAAIAGRIDIVVDPKMSFGTGHHETTRLLLKMMPAHLKPGSRLLDAGTGTAILAIAAVKLQAAEVVAFDIDPWVSDNVAENLALNDATDVVTFRAGSMDVVPETNFDVILANINRNVLLDYLPAFAEKIAPGGYLYLSGVLVEDQSMMEEAATAVGFKLIQHDHEGPWWAGVFQSTASG